MTAAHAVAAAELDGRHTPDPWSPGLFLEELRLESWCRVLCAAPAMDHPTEAAPIRGFVVARPMFEEWHLLNLGVAAAVRRRGWGGRLVAAALRAAARAGSGAVLLEVRRSNTPAQRLYAALGFRELHVRKGYYGGPGPAEDGVVMRRVLTAADRRTETRTLDFS